MGAKFGKYDVGVMAMEKDEKKNKTSESRKKFKSRDK